MDISKEVSKEAEVKAEMTAKGAVFSAEYEGKFATAIFKVEVDAINLLRELAKRTDNSLDDMAVEMISKAL